ncbi:MAG: hypothetical protein M3N43_03670, partial [Actinomycetota bacterium]|nr:hypothetical protein [Actinomycetota bacterium]
RPRLVEDAPRDRRVHYGMGYEPIGTVKGHNRRMSIKPQPPGPRGQLRLGSLRDFQRDQLAF